MDNIDYNFTAPDGKYLCYFEGGYGSFLEELVFVWNNIANVGDSKDTVGTS